MRDATAESAGSTGKLDRPGFFVRNAVTLGILVVAGSMLAVSMGYQVGTLSKPGPGLWPAVVAVVVIVLSIVILVAPPAEPEQEHLGATRWRTLALSVLPLALFAPILVLAGAPLAIFLMAFYWLKVPHHCATVYSLIWAAVFSAAVYAIFVLGLAVPLPEGLIFGGEA